jgi:hypothetical protein
MLSKKNTGGITIPNFKLYYGAIGIKTTRYWHKNRYEDQFLGIDMNLHSYIHQIFDKDDKNIWWRKDSLFSKCYWENWISTCRKLILDPCLSPSVSINTLSGLRILIKELKLWS